MQNRNAGAALRAESRAALQQLLSRKLFGFGPVLASFSDCFKEIYKEDLSNIISEYFQRKAEGEKKQRGKLTREQFLVVQRKGGGEK